MTTSASPDGGSGAPAPRNGWGEPPRYGQYAPGYPTGQPATGAPGPAAPQAAPQYGQSRYGQQPGPGRWDQQGVPPGVGDKLGIIPLRPLTLGEIYDGAFQAVRHNPGVILGFTTVVLAVAAAVGGVISLPITTFFTDLVGLLDDAAPADPADAAALDQMTALIPGLYGVALGFLITLSLAAPLAMGGVALSVSESALDKKVSMGDTWRRVGPRWWFLVALGLLQGLAFLLFLAVVGAVVAGLFALDPGLGVLGVVVGFLGYLVFLAWFLIRTLLIAPALVLERQGFWATVVRGWRLTRGVFWRMFGIYLLTSLILSVLGQILSAPVSYGFAFATVLADPVVVQVGLALTYLVTMLVQTIFLGAVVALLYIDTRMRREGLDVQLAAVAAER